MDNSNSTTAPVLLANESERHVEKLEPMAFRQVGTTEWMKQHMVLQKLNLQAHYCAQTNSENFVLEQFVTHDKFAVAIHELVVIETWAEMICPKVMDTLASKASITGYHILFQEAVLCNLLEVLLYHDYALDACGDALLDLVDYCCRKVVWLQRHGDVAKAPEVITNDTEGGRDTSFSKQATSISYRSSIAAVSILRFICEHASKLPLGISSRLTDAHDVMCLIVPLIENPPWVRRDRKLGKWEKLKDQTWEEVKPEDLLRITSLEAQPWLILYNLMFDEEIRKSYEFNHFRKETVLRVRKFLNETLVDQLPMLSQVQRYLDELSIMNAPAATVSNRSSLVVVQQIAQVRDTLLATTDWDNEATLVVKRLVDDSNSGNQQIISELADMYAGESVEALLSSDLLRCATDPSQQSMRSADVNMLDSELLKEALITLNGKELRFEPSAESTKQKTKHGNFIRVQLSRAPEKVTNPADTFFTQTSNLAVTLKGSEERRIEPLVKRFHVKKTIELPSSEEPHWLKVGSLKDGLVLQVQCVPGSITDSNRVSNLSDGYGKLGEVFVSYQLK